MRIELYAKQTFNVYKELTFNDQSLDIEKAKVVNTQQLIRVLPTFTGKNVKIRKGTHSYDREILTWPTIKEFIRQGTIKPIGLSVEEALNEKTKIETKGEKPKNTDKKAVETQGKNEKISKKAMAQPSLDDLAGEE